jgi:ABC-type branched-subunit amino acid transport system ATPase component
MTMESILDVKQLTMDFGGLRALDRLIWMYERAKSWL